ncbi:MAG TPA: sulfotransferase [Candidatus Elarobacter sp.]|nr:sulfotransferase [Candidatus Elarobacter sp.]
MRYVFVLGAPRTGTTMLGALLGTHRDVMCPGEYFGFYVARSIVPNAIRRIPSALRDAYIADVREHAEAFAERAAKAAGATAFCDATPWNLLIADELTAALSGALFVLCVRRPEGVVQSLARSFAHGFRWAGANVQSRARLYADFYTQVTHLPEERTVAFDYDRFCVQPHQQIGAFLHQLSNRLDTEPAAFDERVLAEAHAPAVGSNPPIAAASSDGRLVYRPRPSYDASALTVEDRAVIARVALPGLTALRSRFPDTIAASTLTDHGVS